MTIQVSNAVQALLIHPMVEEGKWSEPASPAFRKQVYLVDIRYVPCQ